MTYAGLVKRAKSHFENCNNGPEETPVQGDCSYILTPRATGAFIHEIEPKIFVCKYPDSLASENGVKLSQWLIWTQTQTLIYTSTIPIPGG